LGSEKVNILKIASVYTGTVLGAGFASGKELVSFFVSFGLPGFLGMIISGAAFSIIGIGVLKIVYQNNITNYHDFSVLIFGEKIGVISEWIVCGFILILFSAMISAGGEMSHSVFNISRLEGEIILSCLCFIAFLFELDGFVEINTVLAPILVVGGIAVGLYIFFAEPVETFLDNNTYTAFECHERVSLTHNFFISALIYVSYNIITAVTVLVSLNKLISSKKVFSFGGGLGGACVCVLGISMALPLFLYYDKINTAEMPVLNIVLNYNTLKYFYVVILLSAIFTTALANGFSLIQNFDTKNSRKFAMKIFLCIWGVIMAQVGFSNFIEVIYPFFGVIGLFEAFFILRSAFFAKF